MTISAILLSFAICAHSKLTIESNAGYIYMVLLILSWVFLPYGSIFYFIICFLCKKTEVVSAVSENDKVHAGVSFCYFFETRQGVRLHFCLHRGEYMLFEILSSSGSSGWKSLFGLILLNPLFKID